jgi:hypothetical protein
VRARGLTQVEGPRHALPFSPTGRWGLLIFILALLLSGCATPQLSALRAQPPADLPPAAEVRLVPFFPQDAYQCGPAALAMVAQFAGVRVTPDELKPQVYLPDRQGSLQIEMLAATRRQGLVALTLRPQLSDLLQQVAAGQPVVVLQNLSLPIAPLWHYAVVIAYDLPSQTVWLHSGLNERMEMPLATFERTWARGGHWALLALAPNRIPAGTEPATWLRAAQALERVQPASAQQAFEAATRTWPQQPVAWLGLGNSRYRLGQWEDAAQAFEAATRAQPDFAEAWNNLAQVRLEQGRRGDAAQAIAQAVRLGGPRLARYQALQRQLGPP